MKKETVEVHKQKKGKLLYNLFCLLIQVIGALLFMTASYLDEFFLRISGLIIVLVGMYYYFVNSMDD